MTDGALTLRPRSRISANLRVELVRGLADAVAAGESFYKPNDGHPLPRGYSVYADAAIAALHQLHPER